MKDKKDDAPEKSKKEIYAEFIDSMPLTEMYIPFQFPIPLKNSVFVKQVRGPEGEKMRARESGIIIVENNLNDSKVAIPNIGVIMAVGVECADYLRPGQKIIYNPWCEEIVRIYGEDYLRINEATDIYAILPPESWIVPKLKGDRWLFREKRKKEFADYAVRKELHDQNVLDKESELKKKKGKTTLILPSLGGGDA